MEEFKIGDVVSLKSNGIHMTVKSIDENEAVCMWYDNKKEGFIVETFPIIMIKKFRIDVRII